MGTAEYVAIGLFILGGFFTVLWFLLRQKDEKQQKELDAVKADHKEETEKLWKQLHATEKECMRLHADDVQQLQDLRVKIAEKHYEKSELDTKFTKIETTLEAGFERVNDSLDRLNAILLGRAKFITQDNHHHEG